jgi:hypothetical protein
MSVNRDYYVIAGYDLTGWDNDKFDDWKWDNGYDEYFSSQRKGNIQLFDDPMGGYHLYLGYVLAKIDMYECDTIKFDLDVINQVKGNVESALIKLIDLGVISKSPKFKPKYEVIVFEECT